MPVRVSTKHGFNEFREGRAFALADRGVASLAHLHIAISRGLAHYLAETEGFDEDEFEIVHYGIAPRGEPLPYASTAPHLLCVGRLIPIKGHIVLLRAFAAARKAVPGLTLDIAGRGPLEPALKALARELGIAEAIRFLGYVSPIQRAIEEAAVIVVPSMGEGFGMVALEAMERARPVIAASIGGLGELVEDGETGVLVAPGEAEPLAAAIVRVAGDLERAARMGEAGRRARALGVPRGALHGANRRALPRGARRPFVDLDRPRRHSVDRELPSRALEARERRTAALPSSSMRTLSARVSGSSTGEQAGLSVEHELRRGTGAHRRDRLSGEHRFEHREAKPLPARWVDEDVAAAIQRRHISDATRHAARDGRPRAGRRGCRELRGPVLRRGTSSVAPGSSASARIATSTPFCGSRRATQRRSGGPSGIRSGGFGAHGSGSASRP